ncbi:MAG: hypothetical protein MJY87_11440 [Fibrobacter sp.]|nr:hypothetical protein [Fibrobacter sp.]
MIRKAAIGTGILFPFLAGLACAEKSMWEKLKDFFNPGETIECEGPTCDEYHKLESRINTLEGKYSRERRPVHKRRYKHELDSLNVIRDSLIVVIKGPMLDSLGKDSAQAAASSSAMAFSSMESAVSSSTALSSAESVISSSSFVPESSAQNSETSAACKPDTVYVRDTVVVHDTLYVVVTNKPAETPASNSTNP